MKISGNIYSLAPVYNNFGFFNKPKNNDAKKPQATSQERGGIYVTQIGRAHV